MSNLPAVGQEASIFIGSFLPTDLSTIRDIFLPQIQKRTLASLVYEFENKQTQKKERDLTLAAIEMLMLARGHMHIKSYDIKDVGSAFECVVVVRDTLRDLDCPGAARQEKLFEKVHTDSNTGQPVRKLNRFAYTMCLSKAYRNACKRVIPEPVKQAIIAVCMESLKDQAPGFTEVPEDQVKTGLQVLAEETDPSESYT